MEVRLFFWFIQCILYCYGKEAEILSTKSVIYATGETVNITCKINKESVAVVYFFKNGVSLERLLVNQGMFCFPKPIICDYKNKLFTYPLTTENFEDGDTWSCRAEESGPKSNNVTITIVEPFSSIKMQTPIENVVTISVDLVGVFACETSPSRPKADIRWYTRLLNGTENQLEYGINTTSEEIKNSSLSRTKSTIIYTAKKSDNGARVFCKGHLSEVPNDLPKESRAIELNIQYPPSEKPQTDNTGFITVEETNTIDIRCHISGGNPIASLYWECNGRNVSGKITMNETMFQSELSLQAKSEYNNGLCYCIALHPLLAKQKVKTVLKILFPPLRNVTIQSTPVGYINASSTVILKCEVFSGNPVANASWSCDNLNITSLKNDSENKVVSTTIFQVKKKDNGRKCSCTANHYLWNETVQKQIVLNVSFAPDTDLTITGANNSTILYDQDLLILSCTLRNGNPLAKITFKCWKSDTGIDKSNSTTAISVIETTVNQSFNMKICTCTAEHILILTTLEKVIQTTVYYPPTNPQLGFEPSQPFLDGQEVTVTCNAMEGYPDISSYEWFLNDKKEHSSSKTFTFSNITKENNQQSIKCKVNNAFTEFKKQVIESSIESIDVQYHPLISEFGKHVTKNEGMTILQSCIAAGNPIPYVQWFYGDIPVSAKNEQKTTLNLTDIRRTQQGDYNCKAKANSSQHGILESRYMLKIVVNYPPDVSVLVKGNDMSIGTSVILLCNAEGQPDKYIFRGWRHTYQGLEIRSTDKMQTFGNESYLNISELSYQDFGTYSCFVENGIETKSGNLTQTNSTFIAVKGFPIKIPEIPHIQVYTAEQHSPLVATLHFYTFPNLTEWKWYNLTTGNAILTSGVSSNISEAILKYSLYGHIVDFKNFAYEAMFMIQDFQYYQEGFYSLVVSNEERMSNFTFRAQISGPPESPLFLNVSETSDSSITLLLLSGFNGGHNQRFHVLYHELNHPDLLHEQSFFDTKIKPQFLRIINLLPSTSYRLNVYASNKKGNSTLNDTMCCRNLVVQTDDKTEIRSGQQEMQLAGLAAGLAALAFAIIIGILIVIFLRRRVHLSAKGQEENGRLNLTSNSKEDEGDDGDDGMKDNILYVSAGPDFERKGVPSNSEYAMVQKRGQRFKPQEDKRTQQETGLYAEVEKKPKVKNTADAYVNGSDAKKGKDKTKNNGMKNQIAIEDVYENMSDKMKVNSNDNLVKTNRNRDGLQYAELVFNPSPNGSKFVIHGIEDRTMYAVVDTTQKIDPLPESDDETDAQSASAEKQDE